VVVGPEKLPQIARQVGGAWRTLKSLSSRVEEEVRSSLPDLPSTGDLARYARSPATLLDRLATMGADDDLIADPGVTAGVEANDAPLQPDPGAPSPSPVVEPPPARPAPAPSSHQVAAQSVDPSLN
jgi:hypothetical protein